MVDDAPADDRGDVDSESFNEWLDQAADSQGVSRQELMNQMLSSYWILDELTGLVGETGRGADHRPPGPTTTERTQSESKGDSGPETGAKEQDESSTESGSTEESIREIHAAIRKLTESQAGAQNAEDESVPSPTLDGGVVAVVSDLQRQVGKFDSNLEELEARQDTQFDRLSNELQLVLDRVGGLEREQDQLAHEDDLVALAGRVRDLEEVTDEVGELRNQLEKLRSANDDLETRMGREFDSIEDLFSRLLDTIDDLDSDLEAATESYRTELEPIKQHNAEQKRLEELKTEALRREVRRGTCESCDRGVDLALLESPNCPNCASQFSGINDGGWNPFRSPMLETSPIDQL